MSAEFAPTQEEDSLLARTFHVSLPTRTLHLLLSTRSSPVGFSPRHLSLPPPSETVPRSHAETQHC